MSVDINQKLEEVCRLFRIEGTYVGHEMIQVGNVNKTYECKFILPDGKNKSFLVQNVNTYAFRHPVELMDNIDKVTEHIRARKPGQVALHFHHTADRKTYVIDGKNFWRMTNYIPSVTYDAPPNLDLIRNAGKAFGEFQMQLADFKPADLFETIPDFHNTVKRLNTLFTHVAEDPVGRVAMAKEEIAWLAEVRELAGELWRRYESGEFPVRVTHNDTKCNNVLFDKNTLLPLVVVDLDTVMPGLAMYDFGDAVRFIANTAEEDEADISKVSFDVDKFKAFCKGYIGSVGNSLTEAELNAMVMGAFSITVELASRFLDDYLTGDAYFRIKYPEHNIVRARCQIHLAKDILAKREKLEDIVRQYM